MVEKRKRYMAVRETTSAKRRSQSPTTTAGATPEIVHDVPTTFARDGPLPVLPVRQERDLPLKEYKSVAESRVMQESLERSRRKWVDGDIFEKFWTKPLKSRRLDPVEMEKNPGKDCMTRLGSATLSCKPHKFEIKLFGVLEPVKVAPAPPVPTPAPPQPQPQPQTLQRQPQQMQPVNGMQPVQQQVQTSAVPHSQPATQGHVATAPQHYVPAQAPAQRPMHLTPQQQQQQQQQHPQHQQLPQHLQHQQHQQHPQHLQHPQHPQHPQYHPQQQNHHPQQPHPQQPGPPRPDPVIQSLAIRAAEDPELKALMRIVASGKATQEQLKIFQGHIDALTPQPLVPARPIAPAQGLAQPQPQGRPQQMHPHPHQHPQHLQHLQHPQHLQHQQHLQHPHNQQQQHLHPSYMAQHPHPQYQQAHQAPRPQQVAPPKQKPFPQPPKQEITAIVFEFTDPYSQGDRFLFPKYSILEYSKNGMMVIASFIVTRKPIDDLDEYYQPLTITLESTSPRNLEILQRVVKDADTTREHMKKIMATLKRADDSFLAFRLRREPGDAVPDRLDAPLLLPPPPPPGRARESRVRRDASTPVVAAEARETPRGPRVKNVKKVRALKSSC